MINKKCVVSLLICCAACDSGRLRARPQEPEPQAVALPLCGNGELDDGEACDTAIIAGRPGACVKKCTPSTEACIVHQFQGSKCTAECVDVRVVDAHDDDGCCPPEMVFAQDSDCPAPAALCGNGSVDPGERCDPAATGKARCPTSCPPPSACATYTMTGSDCTARCLPALKPRADHDGCCASPGDVDSDCTELPGPGVCPAQALTFKEYWRWQNVPVTLATTSSMVVSPLVTQVNDDNHSGSVDEGDIPDVVVLLSTVNLSGQGAALVAFSGNDGSVLWNRDISGRKPSVYTHPAAADIDHDGKIEIVVAEMGDATKLELAGLIAFENDGSFKWQSDPLPDPIPADTVGAISIADLQGDGLVEILLGNRVFDGQGKLLWAGPAAAVPAAMGRFSFVVDLDPVSPGSEVLDGPNLYAYDGTLLWHSDVVGFGATAVADCDGDGEPEVLVASQPNPPGSANLVLLDRHGKVKAGPKTIVPSGCSTITAGDLDGDGNAEFITSLQTKLVAYDCQLNPVMNSDTIVDVSAGSGAVLFDFDADGKNEIVYADELKLRVMSHTGEELWSAARPHVTALETPVVADIDGDGHAEIVVAQGRLVGGVPMATGVIAYRPDTGQSAGARKTWNQHAFQPSSFFDDGQVAAFAGAYWQRENLFRANRVVGASCP